MKKILLLCSVLAINFADAQTRRSSTTSQGKKTVSETFTNEFQKAKTFAPNGIIRCATTEYHNAFKKTGNAVSDEVFEQWMKEKIEEVKQKRANGTLPAVITIPVVVHVVHSGDAIGTDENIADGQVLSQIQVFNEDFRKLAGTPGDGAGVDTTIQFCLAQVDPNGNPTNGIDRVNTGVASYDTMAAVQAAKAASFWDPKKYLNMWTFKFGGSINTLLGYAQFPTGSGLQGMPGGDCLDDDGNGDSTDGVVCDFGTWGSRTIFPSGNYGSTQYDKGRTMTHEVGHMFGLRHIWGDGGCEVDDFCDDTPNCSNANFGCTAPTQCGNLRQIENYMDYSDDACMNIFTQDQKDRMLAVLLNSPRRDDLLTSNVCEATANTPYIQFKRLNCDERLPKSAAEGNGCSYTEYTIPLSIDKAPSQNATVTFAIDGTSEANSNDIQIVTPSITFNAGATTDQNLVFRVLQDGLVENNEELVINFTVSTTGDAVANPKGDKYNFTILNDDENFVSSSTSQQQIFYDGFESYADFTLGNVGGWTTIDNDGQATYTDDTYDFPGEGYTGSFIVYNPSATTPSSAGGGYDPHSGSKGYYCHNGSGTPPMNDDYAITPLISLGNDSVLKFWAKSLTNNYAGGERFRVEISTTDTNPTSFTLISPDPYTVPPLTWTEYTYDLSSYNNQDVYIAIRVVSQDEFVFMLDDVEVLTNVTISATIQTAVNTSTSESYPINEAGTSNFKDNSSSNIVGSITTNDSSNYGCTSMAVTSSGTGAVQYGTLTNTVDFRMEKQFTITPTSVVTGNATISFYFTEAEIAGWETATGNNRSQLYVVRDNGSQEEIQSLTLTTFGSDVKATASFTGGIDGTYSFARQESLSEDTFELTGVSLYPNPNNGNFTLQLTATTTQVEVIIHDIRGREIFEKSYISNGLLNESINLNNVLNGIYLVTIKDGNRKTTKKIIVQ